jgi:RHS repeat-associated protein
VLNRRSGIVRPSGANTSYSYDGAGRLAGLTQTGVPASTGAAQTFGYNPAGQTTSASQSNSLFQWSGHPITTRNATHDGLNRDAAVVAAAGYDANGNLTFDGTRTFTYDVENRLRTVTGPGVELTLQYDPLGRLRNVQSDGQNLTSLTYDGGRIFGDTTGFYLYGPGVDEPLGTWKPGGPGSPVTYLHADRQGSIVGTSDGTGAITPLTYGPYGEPQTWSGSRIRYTGQLVIPEAQLYYYKARMYDPVMGRFLQTDPIGYGDGPNIYAYVGGDPVNFSDPTGNGRFWDWFLGLFGSSAPGENPGGCPNDGFGCGGSFTASLGACVEGGDAAACWGWGSPPPNSPPPLVYEATTTRVASGNGADAFASGILGGLAPTICSIIPDARTTTLTGGIGGIGSVYGATTVLVNYNTGQTSVYGTGGVQFGWNGGVSWSVGGGAVYGMEGDSNSYSGPFRGGNASVPPIPVGANVQTGGGVTEYGVHAGGNLTPAFPSGGATKSITSAPVDVGTVITPASIPDLVITGAKNLAC